MNIYVSACHSITDVEVDYNLYVGESLEAAKNAASKEMEVNPNAHSVRIESWDIVSQKAKLVETLYRA